MTISATSYTPQTHTGAGTGPYAFQFECLDNTVFVLIDDEVSPIAYTVQLNGNGPIYQGGTVTFDAAIPASSTITIGRATPADQQIPYGTYTRFPAQTHELALDKLTLIAQETEGGGGGVTPTAFLPLAGGEMNPEARIGWSTASGARARMLMTTFLTVPAFIIQPQSLEPDMGFVFQIDDAVTKYLAASVDGVWAIEGRPDFASLPDNAIATKADVQTGGGQFMPLAGGTYDDDASVQWGTVGAGGAQGIQTFASVFASPGFIWQPATGSQDQGYVFQIDEGLTKYMAGSVDGTWAIEGRPEFSTLSDTAIALKGDVAGFMPLAGGTWDEGALQVFPLPSGAPTSSAADMGFINFFGIHTLRIQALTANTDLGIGYLLLTDAQNEVFPFLVGSKYDGWRLRNQLYTDPEALVTVTYLESNTYGLSPEVLDVEYVIKNGVWVPNTGGSGGEANTASNLGAGEGIFAQKNAIELEFKSLIAGTDVNLVSDGNTITINFTGGGGGTAWGGISGDINAQADLQAELDARFKINGDTWGADVQQLFTRPATLPSYSGGTMRFTNYLGIPGWLWGPQDIGGTEQVGYLWDTTVTGSGPALGGNPTDGFEIRDQVLGSNESIVTRSLGDARYAPILHTHPISQITGLQSELDDLQTQINGKAPSSAVSTATWGSVNGALSNQSDLQFALNAKLDISVAESTYAAIAENEVITGIYTFSAGFSASVGVALSGGALMGNSRIQGIGDAVNPQDVPSLSQVEALIAAALP